MGNSGKWRAKRDSEMHEIYERNWKTKKGPSDYDHKYKLQFHLRKKKQPQIGRRTKKNQNKKTKKKDEEIEE